MRGTKLDGSFVMWKTQSSTLHLAIDIEACCYAGNKLTSERKENFPTQIRLLADKLWQNYNIPTCWFVYRKDPCSVKLYKHLFFRNRATLAAQYGLIRLERHESIFIKCVPSGFSPENWIDFSAYLRQNKISTLILSGMQTRYCIASNLRGGAQKGFHMLVVIDALADSETPEPQLYNHQWHKQQLQVIQDRYPNNVQFILSNDIL